MKSIFRILTIFALVVIIGFVFTACPSSPSGGGGGNGGKQQQPTTTSVQIEVPSTLGGFVAGKKITIIFPAGTSKADQDIMKDKIAAALPYLDEWIADGDTALGTELNGALNRPTGLTITVRATSDTMFKVDINNKQLRMGSFWLKVAFIEGEDIANEMAIRITIDGLLAIMRQMDMSKDTVRLV